MDIDPDRPTDLDIPIGNMWIYACHYIEVIFDFIDWLFGICDLDGSHTTVGKIVPKV